MNRTIALIASASVVLLLAPAVTADHAEQRVVLFELLLQPTLADPVVGQEQQVRLHHAYTNIQVAVDCSAAAGSVDAMRPDDSGATVPALSWADGHCLTQSGPHGYVYSITLQKGAYSVEGRAAGAGTLHVVVTGVQV